MKNRRSSKLLKIHPEWSLNVFTTVTANHPIVVETFHSNYTFKPYGGARENIRESLG